MKWIGMAILLLALSACGPTETASQSSDPSIDKAVAEARIKSTEQAKVDREAAAKLADAKEQKKTEREITLIMAPVYAKQTEVALEIAQGQFQITQAAAKITQAAAERQAGLDELEIQKIRVETQLEITRKQREEANKAAWDEIWRWAWPLLAFALCCVVIGLLYFLPPKAQAHILEQRQLWQDQKRLLARQKESVLVLTDGSKWWFDENGIPERIDPGNGAKALPEGATAGVWSDGSTVTVREVGASVLISKARTADRSTTGRCLALVNAAIQKEGDYGFCIPRFDKVGYYSKDWQDLTNAMEEAEIVEKDATGTFLTEGGGMPT